MKNTTPMQYRATISILRWFLADFTDFTLPAPRNNNSELKSVFKRFSIQNKQVWRKARLAFSASLACSHALPSGIERQARGKKEGSATPRIGDESEGGGSASARSHPSRRRPAGRKIM